MLLLSASEAAEAIGAKCGGSAPDVDDPGLIRILNYLLPRVEGALNVHSLVRQSYVDHFFLGSMPRYRDDQQAEASLLLSNGFVVPETVVLTGPDGSVLTGAEVLGLKPDEGVIIFNSWLRGGYSVAYTAGFEVPAMPTPPDPLPPGYVAPDPDSRVLLNVPTWIKGVCINLLVLWFRTMRISPRVSKDLSYKQVDDALRRELYARVYEKYMRPRVSVTFSDRMDRVA